MYNTKLFTTREILATILLLVIHLGRRFHNKQCDLVWFLVQKNTWLGLVDPVKPPRKRTHIRRWN